MIFILFTVVILFTLYIIIPSIFKIILRKHFLLKIRKDNNIYLTFDDGPNPNSTPQILNILKKHKAYATFFITWKNAEKHPEIVSNILKMGHDVGDHGFYHLHPWKSDPINSYLDYISSRKAIASLTKNYNVIYYRPPYGKLNFITLLYFLISRKKMIFWDVDPKDYNSRSINSVKDYVIERLDPGKIILLHDGRGNSDYSNINITINALELIIKACHKKGLKLCSIRDAI